jgi:ADP-ribosylglycohydrolase
MTHILRPRYTADHYSGCLLAGAIGDALGGPTEFMRISEIRSRYGLAGQTGYVSFNQLGQAAFTDDTQMTLFTAEGLLEGLQQTAEASQPDLVAPTWQAYQRWLQTQNASYSNQHSSGLLAHPELWKRQAPGNTCLSTLVGGRPGSPERAINNSKGCGGVMRVAPAGLLLPGKQAFRTGAQTAALTHGHPSGYLSAGLLAEIIAGLAAGLDLAAAIQAGLETLCSWPNHEETLTAVQRALELADNPRYLPGPETVESLGGGWVGEEALAISIYCALQGESTGSLREGVLLAVNHSGDNDSTGAITGNILGLLMGKSAIPPEWIEPLELKTEIEALALRILAAARLE